MVLSTHSKWEQICGAPQARIAVSFSWADGSDYNWCNERRPPQTHAQAYGMGDPDNILTPHTAGSPGM